VGLALIVAGAVVASSTGVLPDLAPAGAASSSPDPSAAAADVETAAVERRTMRTTAELEGTLGYEGSLTVLAGSGGTVTSVPQPGSVIKRGGVLYELDGRHRPRLFIGTRPMWRALGPGVSNGADVLQLEQNLKALGYTRSGMKVDRHWDSKTTAAVKRWQKATGQARDGTVEQGDIVFLPSAIRVRAVQATLGAGAGPATPILDATSARRVVTVDLPASRRSLVEVDQAVTVELPGGREVPGRIRSIGRVATAGENGAGATLPVTIDLEDGAELPDLDEAPVTVHIVTETRADVLAVPVNALVALLEGGYAVEVAADDGTRRYVGVEVGLFEDGMVEVTATGLDAGDRVVVPA
jgi:peptidoglycan hydrolase-like protein with peptidoglycan-binding domain